MSIEKFVCEELNDYWRLIEVIIVDGKKVPRGERNNYKLDEIKSMFEG